MYLIAITPIKELLSTITNLAFNKVGAIPNLPDPIIATLNLGAKCCFPPPPHGTLDKLSEDLKRFGRSLRLHKYFFNSDREMTEIERKFKVPSGFDPLYVKHIKMDFKSISTTIRAIESKLPLLLTQVHSPKKIVPIRSIRLLKQLRDHPEVLFQLADKGLGLTAINRQWYLSQGYKTLSKGYKQLDENTAVTRIRNYYNKVLVISKTLASKLINLPIIAKFITSRDYTEHRSPVLYLLPKLHKDPIGTRPIVAGHSSCLTASAKVADWYFSDYLTQSTVILRDSTELLLALEELHIPHDVEVCLATADITNLYGVIPLFDLQELMKQLKGKSAQQSDVQIHILMQKLASYVLQCNVVLFDNKSYLQTEGVAMGSPFGPTAANLFLHHVLDTKLTSTSAFPRIIRVYRYLDDLFFVLRGSSTENLSLQRELNLIHRCLQFTVDISDQSVHFLDLNISFKDHHFHTSLYTKPMSLFLYIPALSFHTRPQLTAFIKGETLRILRVSSTLHSFQKSLQSFVTHLHARGYTTDFILQAVKDISYLNRPSVLASARAKLQQVKDASHNKHLTSSDISASSRSLIFVTDLSPLTISKDFRNLISDNMNRLALLDPEFNDHRLLIARRRAPTIGGLIINNSPPLNSSSITSSS